MSGMTSFTLQKDLAFTSEYFIYEFTTGESFQPIFHFNRVIKDTDIDISVDDNNQICVKRTRDDSYYKRLTFELTAIDLMDKSGTYIEMIESMKSIIRDIKLKEVL